MRARDLAAPFPAVGVDTPAMEAARLLAGENLPGLIVVDGAGRPLTILPGTQVLRMAVPRYCQDDPALARVIDEAAADVFRTPLVAVVGDDRCLLGAITLDALLDRLVGQ